MTDQTDITPQPLPPMPVRRSFVERYSIPPIIFAFVCLLVVFVLYQLIGGFITLLLVGAKVTRDNVMMQRLFTMVGQLLLILLPTLVFARLLDTRRSRVFPWRTPRVGESIFAVLSLVFLQEVLQIYLFFQDRIPLPKDVQKFIEPFQKMMEEMYRILVGASNIPELLFVVLAVSVTPAIVEELLFRGVVQSSFERSTTPAHAAIWTGVIFGLFHFNPFALVPLIILGCFFGILRMRSKSMALPMTVHFLNNALAVVVAYLQMDDKMVIGATTGEGINIPSILAQLILFSALFAVTFSSYLRSTADVSLEGDGHK